MSHPLSLDIECLNCSLQSWVSAVDVCYHTLCNPDNVVFKPIASQLSSNFPALWPAGAECHFLAPRRRKAFFPSLYLFIEPLSSPGRILVIFCVVCFGSRLGEPSLPFNGWLLASFNAVVSLPLEREAQTQTLQSS